MTDLLYPTRPETPQDFEKNLSAIVPLCPTGERYLRFRWAPDITEEFDGQTGYRYPDIYNNPPKYCAMPYFIMEGWQSPEVFDRDEWEATRFTKYVDFDGNLVPREAFSQFEDNEIGEVGELITFDVLGEFPEKGVWDFIEVLRGDEGETLPLGGYALQLAQQWAFWRTKPHKRVVAQLLDARAKRAEDREKRLEQKAGLIWTDFHREINNAAAGHKYRKPKEKFVLNGSILVPN